MSFFVQSMPPLQPKTKNIRPISLVFAGLLVIMIVGQLFTFEEFPAVVQQMNFTDSKALASILAAFIVVLEVAALPFLLFMWLSPAARIVSMLAGWVVATAWLVASTWINLTVQGDSNSGFLGATVPLISGWWTVFFSLALGVLAVWAAWGMWPLGKKHR